MIVPEELPIEGIDSITDPKLGPVVVVYSPEAERDVRETHTGQHPLFVRMWREADRRRFAELLF